MAYKNLFHRSLLSVILIFIYLLILIINFQFVFYLIISIYFIILYEIFFNFKRYYIPVFIYVFISFIFFASIEFNQSIILNFNLFIFSIVTFDIFSYIFGKLLGYNKLTKLSPNKTYEGLIGGFLISLISSLLFCFIFQIEIDITLITFIILIITAAFIGDILESFFKRKNEIKNSSELIPGHGGVFDRFDGFLFSIILYSIFNLL